jgi:hypothetical protein
VISTVKEAFSTETLETVLHAGLGVTGALAGTKLVTDQIPAIKTPIGGIAVSAGVSILGSTLINMAGQRVFATRFLFGGMLATALHVLGLVLPKEVAAWTPTVGLGQAESEEFRAAVQEEVLQQLQAGQGAYVPPAGAEMYVPPAGAEAYLTEREALGAGAGAYLTEREAIGAGVGAYDEISGASGPERF